MKTNSVLLTGMAIASALLGSSSASAFPLLFNPWKNLPVPYYVTGNQVFDAAHKEYQDKVVIPRCTQVAKETTMSDGKAFFELGWNGGFSNAVGQGGSTVTQYAIAGAKLNPLTGELVMAGSFVAGAIISGAGGVNSAHSQFWGTKVNCAGQDAAGLHEIPPSIAKKIAKGELPPQSFGSPFEQTSATTLNSVTSKAAATQSQ